MSQRATRACRGALLENQSLDMRRHATSESRPFIRRATQPDPLFNGSAAIQSLQDLALQSPADYYQWVGASITVQEASLHVKYGSYATGTLMFGSWLALSAKDWCTRQEACNHILHSTDTGQ